MLIIKIDTDKLKIWRYWEFLKALREIQNINVPPNDATGQQLQDVIYECKSIAYTATGEAET